MRITDTTSELIAEMDFTLDVCFFKESKGATVIALSFFAFLIILSQAETESSFFSLSTFVADFLMIFSHAEELIALDEDTTTFTVELEINGKILM